ncbi:MAG: hypothetical protein ACJ77E_03460, partial [Gaiellaceae bacterium]
VGRTLRVSTPRWTQKPDAVSWRWLLCTARGCKTIRGATRPTLGLVPGYAGRSVQAFAVARFGTTTVRAGSRRILVRLR